MNALNKGVIDKQSVLSFRGGGLEKNVSRQKTQEDEDQLEDGTGVSGE